MNWINALIVVLLFVVAALLYYFFSDSGQRRHLESMECKVWVSDRTCVLYVR